MSSKIPVQYEEITEGGETCCIALRHRDNRFPVTKVLVTPAGAIELHCADGAVEVLGSPAFPCSTGALRRIRTHHDGLLLIQVDPDRVEGGVTEQLLSARFM